MKRLECGAAPEGREGGKRRKRARFSKGGGGNKTHPCKGKRVTKASRRKEGELTPKEGEKGSHTSMTPKVVRRKKEGKKGEDY